MPKGIYKRNLKLIINKGDKFGRLTAIKFSYRDKKSQQFWLFKCNCGNEKVMMVYGVKNGKIKSCGCSRKKHGMINTKTYKSWQSMKQRCLNLNNNNYKYWGGRGITICDEWLKFENFYKDMGNKPKGKSLDRIDNNKNYCKENCRWATPKEQQNNMRRNHLIIYNDKTQTVSQWAEELGLNCNRIFQRLNRGWSIEKSLSKIGKYVYRQRKEF